MSGTRDPRRRQVEILHAGGWTSPTKIRELIARDGTTPPSLHAIRCWIDPEFEQRARDARRRSVRRLRERRRLADVRLDRLTEVEMWELALEVTR